MKDHRGWMSQVGLSLKLEQVEEHQSYDIARLYESITYCSLGSNKLMSEHFAHRTNVSGHLSYKMYM